MPSSSPAARSTGRTPRFLNARRSPSSSSPSSRISRTASISFGASRATPPAVRSCGACGSPPASPAMSNCNSQVFLSRATARLIHSAPGTLFPVGSTAGTERGIIGRSRSIRRTASISSPRCIWTTSSLATRRPSTARDYEQLGNTATINGTLDVPPLNGNRLGFSLGGTGNPGAYIYGTFDQVRVSAGVLDPSKFMRYDKVKNTFIYVR